MAHAYGWTAEQIDAAIGVLRASTQVNAALPAIESATGRRVSRDSLKAAFSERELGAPSLYLRSDAPPPRAESHEDDCECPRCNTGRSPAAESVRPPLAPSEPVREAQGRVKTAGAAALFAAIKSGALEFEALCDRLDLSPKACRALVTDAQSQGHRIEFDGGHVGLRPQGPHTPADERRVAMPAAVKGRHSFLVASDIHVGSKNHLRDQLEDHVERAYVRGVRVGLCPGDLLDGVYRHSVWEQSHRGFDEQCREAARSLPKRPGWQWHFCLGNHDQTFEDSAGLDVGRAIVDTFRSEGRTDWTYHGSRGCYLRLGAPGERGIVVELWHPCKGGGYALTYAMQNHIRDYAVGYKPDALFTGHWHQSCYFTSRGVHAHSSGTFQGGRSPYGKSLGGSPAIGGWIVDYATTADGTIREWAPTWNAYYEHEAPRDIEIGRAS